MYDISGDAQIIAGGDLKILYVSGRYVPFLSCTGALEMLPSVKVDMGAVKFVCNGADIMRPGITSHDAFGRDAVVTVAEPGGKYLAVGTSLEDSSRIESMEKGGAVKNLHYISDKYWEAGKAIR